MFVTNLNTVIYIQFHHYLYALTAPENQLFHTWETSVNKWYIVQMLLRPLSIWA
jgi:hypothetical protein